MSHLQPEKRMDANGKVVTRHVKPSTGADRSWTPPAPIPQIRWQHVAIANALGRIANEESIARIQPGNLNALHDLVTKHDLKIVNPEILQAAYMMQPAPFNKCAIMIGRHWDTAVSSMNDRNGGLIAKSNAISVTSGILRHKFRMTEAQEATLVEAVSRVWSYDWGEDSHYDDVFPDISLTSDQYFGLGQATIREDLAQLIVSHPDKIGVIVECLTERKLTDLKEITELVMGTTPALAEGAL